MTIGFSTALRTARADAVIAAIDNGSGDNGIIEVYDDPRPATGAAVTSQAKAATLNLSKPCATNTDGVLTFNNIEADPVLLVSTTISWARFYDADSSFVCDMSCGLAGSGAEIIYNIVETTTGGKLEITSGSMTEGNL